MNAADQFQAAIETLADQIRTAALQIHARGLSRPDLVNHLATLISKANAEAVTLADLGVTAQLQEITGQPVTHAGLPPEDSFDRLTKSIRAVLDSEVKTKFTRAEIRALIEQADLNPRDWDIPKIQKRINGWVRDMLPDAEGILPEESALSFEDFVEVVSEHPKTLTARGLFPPPPPGTPEYERWKTESLLPDIDSDDYRNFDPIWEREPQSLLSRLERLAGNEPLQAAQRAAGTILGQKKPPRGRYYGWVRQLNATACTLCQWWAKDGRIFPADHGMARHTNCACVQRIVHTTTKPKPVKRRRK